MNNNITVKSTLEEAYLAQESVSVWSANSKKAYRRNIKLIAEHMKSVGLEPIIENVTYDYGKKWLKDHYGTFQPSTLNQRKSTIPSLFSHLNNEGIITGNPFLNLEIEDYSAESHLSKDLNLVELYQVYKAAHELQSEGVNVLAPILTDIYTGLRSTNLKELKVNSLDHESSALNITLDKMEVNFQEEEKRINSKNREGFLPLPPKAMSVLVESAEGKEPEDALLYGLRGKAFANKQMNYIVRKICEHLGWIIKTSVTEKEGVNTGSKITKTDKYFTPHGLRYSVATIFHDMGVEDNAIRMLLLHSKKTTQGVLSRYFRKDSREVKQLRIAQLLLETVLETALEMEEKFNVEMDLESIYEQLPVAFENQKKNAYYINVFKDDIIRFTFSRKMEQMLSTTTDHSNSLFHTAEGINVAPTHSMAPIYPYQQYGLQPTGYPMAPPQMNYNYPPQPPTGHYPPYFYGPYAKK
ncbi:integrase [Lysinibacillus yapensis]|uniref:Integrase n=1 Tax=Ureibacillus yapensis TaxID=2304605 RepID=A0A396SCL4_9BACL|nr:tyrosine-type recombinase/integrase [Lysinibacillus yapensis]RHW37447.1 integrase [Lysinibacillus yapensis]